MFILFSFPGNAGTCLVCQFGKMILKKKKPKKTFLHSDELRKYLSLPGVLNLTELTQ